MTGNVLTTNPVTGTPAYANGAYGTTQQGTWGTNTGFGVNTPAAFGTPVYQTAGTYPINTIGTIGGFTTQLIPQAVQQPSFLGQTIGQQQGGFINTTPQFGFQGLINAALQTTPQQVVNTILQTTPPQVLPYILNALACQQACEQVLQQNPQAVQNINPQTITQPFLALAQAAQQAAQAQAQFGQTAGFGVANPFTTGFQAQMTPFQQAACVGCGPTGAQWTPTVATRFGTQQVVPQQAWISTPYGTW